MFISDKRAFLSALGLNKATKDKKAAELKRGKHTRKNLKHKQSELTTKTAGEKSDVEKVTNKKSRVEKVTNKKSRVEKVTNKKSHVEKVTNKKSRVDQIKHEVVETIKSKIEK